MVKHYMMCVHANASTYLKARGPLIVDLCGGMSEDDDDKDNEKASKVEFINPEVRGSFFSSAHLSSKGF